MHCGPSSPGDFPVIIHAQAGTVMGGSTLLRFPQLPSLTNGVVGRPFRARGRGRASYCRQGGRPLRGCPGSCARACAGPRRRRRGAAAEHFGQHAASVAHGRNGRGERAGVRASRRAAGLACSGHRPDHARRRVRRRGAGARASGCDTAQFASLVVLQHGVPAAPFQGFLYGCDGFPTPSLAQRC